MFFFRNYLCVWWCYTKKYRYSCTMLIGWNFLVVSLIHWRISTNYLLTWKKRTMRICLGLALLVIYVFYVVRFLCKIVWKIFWTISWIFQWILAFIKAQRTCHTLRKWILKITIVMEVYGLCTIIKFMTFKIGWFCNSISCSLLFYVCF